jgi:hypothetical protein
MMMKKKKMLMIDNNDRVSDNGPDEEHILHPN